MDALIDRYNQAHLSSSYFQTMSASASDTNSPRKTSALGTAENVLMQNDHHNVYTSRVWCRIWCPKPLFFSVSLSRSPLCLSLNESSYVPIFKPQPYFARIVLRPRPMLRYKEYVWIPIRPAPTQSVPRLRSCRQRLLLHIHISERDKALREKLLMSIHFALLFTGFWSGNIEHCFASTRRGRLPKKKSSSRYTESGS